ncbi:hypothetical protein DICPUDRAFT_49642 [Dictyostelium purpureum]|uniref:Uncharacterized protein n=1 Tax=Dictyostelium purpureum TaxID=5786 RepID=F0ZUN5_DICPU|nr:uncharacterized protein DICPUDRAFT_49642 [Dictyostelium purpureum]EGC32327.1 hypothetical protein DICPUDRAFT_49642 [Dictyostelium purpureum]|eukprot:XP_003291129.1 hypothetical protein DICPUDRAFT_49642 [Dictyostelium purpureum]
MEFESDKLSLEAAGHLFKKIGNHDPKTIAKVLMNGKSHPLIKLEKNDLGDAGIIPISKALKQQAIVSSLDLSCNNITSAGIKELCQGIANNKYLMYLKLDNNPIGNEGFKAICDVLKSKECVLKSIYLSECNITHRGMHYFVDALQFNRSLETIHLNSNKLGNEGATLLSKCITIEGKLKNISLFFCAIGDGGANSFLSILDKKDFIDYKLISLTLKGNKVSQSIQEQIYKILIDKKNAIKANKIKAENQMFIEEEIKQKVASINEQCEKKIKDIDEQTKKELNEKIKDLDKENKKKLEERINNINEESRKKLDERMKNIDKKEETLNSRNEQFSERLKTFEKEQKRKSGKGVLNSSQELNLSSNGIKKPQRKKFSDSIIIVIAGDKTKDKDLFIEYCMTALEGCKIEAENDFEKIFTGVVTVDDKPIHFTFVNTSSDDRYSRLRALQYEQADAAVIAFTINDRVSFEDIPFQWIPEIEFMGKIPILIAGMFSDKRSVPLKATDISEEEGKATSLKFGALSYFEPNSSMDIKNLAHIVYKEIKKKKKL